MVNIDIDRRVIMPVAVILPVAVKRFFWTAARVPTVRVVSEAPLWIATTRRHEAGEAFS